MFTYSDLNVEFTNSAPYFINDVPINLTLKFNNSFEYLWPSYTDKEGNEIFLFISGFPPVGSFINLLGKEKMIIHAT
jgi:hypothetical protein